MKKIVQLFILSVFAFLAFTCEEIPPVLNPSGGNGGGEVPVENQPRQVLIEEFTGVRCVNCPAGSEAIRALQAIHGHQLVAVSIHAGFFSNPYPESGEDLGTAEGESIQSLVEEPIGYPSAVVNRRVFEGESSRQIGQSSWAGFIAQELAEAPQVKIDIKPEYDAATRQLEVVTDLYWQNDLTSDDIRLSLYITENDVIDSQLTPDGRQDDYPHRHVFRKALSAFDGELLPLSVQAGSLTSRSFSYTLPDAWNANNCHVVAFVHYGGGTLDVLQAHEVEVVE